MMKIASILGVLLSISTIVAQGCSEIRSSYEYERTISAPWTLMDRASTIEEKAKYCEKFVAALEMSVHTSHNADFYPTPENSWEDNLNSLKSLKKRLDQIKSMNVSSFEYQAAIQQITAQEMGEAQPMLNVFQGCWKKANYPLIWGWHAFVIAFSAVGILMFSLVGITVAFDID